MGANYNPGDVDISDLTLEGKNYLQNFVSLMIQEHIMSPMVKGSIEINQSEGAQAAFDGSQDSTITFRTPEGEKRRYSLRTNSINNVTGDAAQRSRNFIVDLVSKHALINNATPNFQKSFKNQQISEIIGSILEEGLGLEIPFNISETRGLQGSDYQPMILTQKTPLQHIDDLRRMAISSQNYDGFMLFSGIGQSGREELNFKSIFEMIKGSSVANITNMSNFEMNDSLKSMMNNAIEIWLPEQTDALAKGSTFSSGTTMFDMNTMTASVPELAVGSERQQLGSQTSMNPGQTSGFINEAFNGMPGTGNLILEDTRRPESGRAETAPYTEALMADIMQNSLTVKIPGNSNLKVGDIIDFDFRENTENFLNKDTKFYGKNLIAGLTHYIGPISDRPRYVTYLDLVNIQTYNGKIA